MQTKTPLISAGHSSYPDRQGLVERLGDDVRLMAGRSRHGNSNAAEFMREDREVLTAHLHVEVVDVTDVRGAHGKRCEQGIERRFACGGSFLV